jgi:hypothetical protein
MHPSELKTDFDRWISLSERADQEEAIACNDAFVARMNAAIGRKRETAKPGIYVDLTPSTVHRIRGDLPISPCGSPAAMCADNGYAGGLTEAVK